MASAGGKVYMRQQLGPKKVAKLRAELNLPIVKILVRGNTDHRLDLCLEDQSVLYYWPHTGEFEKSELTWGAA